MTADQLLRLRYMASGAYILRLSEYDREAISTACDELGKMFKEKPESFLADCCRFAKCTRHVDGERVDYIPPHGCVGQEPESPIDILENLGDAGVDDPEPEGGGSIRA